MEFVKNEPNFLSNFSYDSEFPMQSSSDWIGKVVYDVNLDSC